MAANPPLIWPFKDPNEILDYQINWAPRLAGDIIITSTWLFTGAGLTLGADGRSATVTTLWLSDGVETWTYTITNRITTVAGRTMDQTVQILIKSK